MKREMKLVNTSDLVHCEWNPRSVKELDAEHPAMQELIANVRGLGVLQPIVVWDAGGELIVIAGNRRFAAAKHCGVKTLQAVVVSGIDEARAREITRVENEVRLGIDPIADAGLVGSMIDLGYSQKEIAAHFGVSEARICRRAKLLSLIPDIRKIAQESGKLTVDALENIASYPQDIQTKLLVDVKRNVEQRDRVTWGDIHWAFESKTKNLDDVEFCTDDCRRCAKRTGACGSLFVDENDTREDLGRCFDGDCFDKKMSEWRTGCIRAALGTDGEIVDIRETVIAGKRFWTCNQLLGDYPKLFGKSRTKSRPTAYYSACYAADDPDKCWGPKLSSFAKIVAEQNAAAEREAAARRAEEEEEEKRMAELVERRKPLSESCMAARESFFEEMEFANVDLAAFAKEIAGSFKGLSGRARDAIADVLRDAFDDYYFRDHHGFAIAELVLALDDFRAKTANLAQTARNFVDADAALAKFNAENRMDD